MVAMPETIGSPMLWLGFTAFIVAMLALDLGVLHRDAHEVSVREAFTWSLVWIALSFAFAGGLYVLAGRAYALQFVTGYLIEKALSVDNVFVFLVVFSFFKVPSALQHRVLFWGIFGALLIFTGVKMLTAGNEEVHPNELVAYRLFRRIVPSTDTYREGHFFVRE